MRGRAIQVSLVRKPSAPTTDGAAVPVAEVLDPDQINALVKDQVQNLAMSVGTVLLVKKAADTLSELILIAGRKHL